MNTGAAGNAEFLLPWTSSNVRRILGGALDGGEIGVDDAIVLAGARGRDLAAVGATADEMRRRQAGDVVTFVVNRDHREEEGYFLPVEEVVRRAKEAWDLGATEVCIQAGLPPKLDGRYYIDLCRALKRVLPDIHLHAFSPEEVL